MTRPVVAISCAEVPEQTALGYGREHLAEALVRIARLLLRQGCHIAYGGDLREDGFTLLLLHVVRAENASSGVGPPGKPTRSEMQRRMVNFLSWPRWNDLTPDVHARYLGACRFVQVPTPDVVAEPPLAEKGTPRYRLATALSIATMRRAMQLGGAPDFDGEAVPGASARLVIGGKVEGYTGFLPGIFEEVALALATGAASCPVPVFILGGFGGAAAVLARAFLCRDVPPELTRQWQLEHNEHLAPMLELCDGLPCDARQKKLVQQLGPQQHYDVLARQCRRGVAALGERNGLTERDNEILLTSSVLSEVLGVLTRAAALRRQ